MRDDEPRTVLTSLPITHGSLRCVRVYYCSTYFKASYSLLFITAVPNTKLCAWGEEDSGGHVL